LKFKAYGAAKDVKFAENAVTIPYTWSKNRTILNILLEKYHFLINFCVFHQFSANYRLEHTQARGK
jgi:hypothetical protein